MKKNLCLGLFFVLLISVLAVFPVQAAQSASYCINDGSLVIGEAEDEIHIFVEQNGVVTLLPSASTVKITGRGVTTNTVFIKNNVTVNLILENVSIQSATFLKAPLCIDNGETVQITLVGDNSLVGSDFMAGLQTSGRAKVSIVGDGKLTAKGGKDAAGIGGGWRASTPGSHAGTLTIGGNVKILAEGGENAAGIGGGMEGGLKLLTVKDAAQITATGGAGGAGIGGGNGGQVSEIRLEGSGKLLATGGYGAAAIGGGNTGEVTRIEVTGSHPMRLYGGEGAAALGSGKGGSLSTLLINGSGSIRAMGGTNGAAIGLGESAKGTQILLADSVSVFAVGQNGPAVGCGKNAVLDSLSLDQNCNVNAFGGNGAAALGSGEGAKLNTLSVMGNTKLIAVGGKEGAGIGGGKGNTPSAIQLGGRSEISAIGGLGGAGIGGGNGAAYSDITISSSAKVSAHGGNYGAGIGSGAQAAAETALSTHRILITDQTNVKAYGGKSGSGIGGGVFGAGSILEISQNAKVIATGNCELSLNLPQPAIGSFATIATFSSSPFSLDLSAHTADGTDLEDGPRIFFNPDPATVSSAAMTFPTGSALAKDAGNGAGCSIAGTTHISGGATLNGIVGDVTLTMVVGNGAADMVVTLTKNEHYTPQTPAAKAGYTFRGWYKDAQLTKPVTGSLEISQDTVIYAGWDAIQVELAEGEIPFAYQDDPYSYQFVAASGTESTTFSLYEGSLPAGLELKESGELCGTPTQTGKFNFTIRYLNSNGTWGTKDVILAVYGTISYTFHITTGSSNGSGSQGQVMMSFRYTDRFTGQQKTTTPVDLTSLLLKSNPGDPWKVASTVKISQPLEPNVGNPEEILFTCEGADGWYCQGVRVVFAGDEMTPAFDQSFSLEKWYGTPDDNNFWGIFLIVVIVIASLIIVLGSTFLILIRTNKPFRDFVKSKGFLQGTKKKAPPKKKSPPQAKA